MRKVDLSEEQKQTILDEWNKSEAPPAINDLTKLIFGPECDGRSAEGRCIKEFLATRNLKAKSSFYQPVGEKTNKLTREQELFVVNNHEYMNALEMAREIFCNPSLSNLHGETRCVNDFMKEKGYVSLVNDVADEIPDGDYTPPQTFDKVFKKANFYLNGILDRNKITPTQRKGLESLINYLNTYKIMKQINIYDANDDRKSFEDAFVRYTYDKPELSQEEVDQYCSLANEVVIAFKAQRRSERLQAMLDEITNNDPESARISMSLVEAINKAQAEYNNCITRQQKLKSDLTEKRSDKLTKKIQENASVLNLINAWQNEEHRKEFLKMAELEQKAVSDELDHIINMDDIKARLLGVTVEEIRNG